MQSRDEVLAPARVGLGIVLCAPGDDAEQNGTTCRRLRGNQYRRLYANRISRRTPGNSPRSKEGAVREIYQALNEAYPFPPDHRIFVNEWPLESVSQDGHRCGAWRQSLQAQVLNPMFQ